MKYFKTNSLIVMDDKKPRGIITHSDLEKRVYEKKLDPLLVNVEEIMSQPLIYININATEEQADNLLMEHKIKQLPIITNIEEKKIPLGMYTKTENRALRERKLKNLIQSQLSIKILE
jgi:CBS domain-containing protein